MLSFAAFWSSPSGQLPSSRHAAMYDLSARWKLLAWSKPCRSLLREGSTAPSRIMAPVRVGNRSAYVAPSCVP